MKEQILSYFAIFPFRVSLCPDVLLSPSLFSVSLCHCIEDVTVETSLDGDEDERKRSGRVTRERRVQRKEDAAPYIKSKRSK